MKNGELKMENGRRTTKKPMSLEKRREYIARYYAKHPEALARARAKPC